MSRLLALAIGPLLTVTGCQAEPESFLGVVINKGSAIPATLAGEWFVKYGEVMSETQGCPSARPGRLLLNGNIGLFGAARLSIVGNSADQPAMWLGYWEEGGQQMPFLMLRDHDELHLEVGRAGSPWIVGHCLKIHSTRDEKNSQTPLWGPPFAQP